PYSRAYCSILTRARSSSGVRRCPLLWTAKDMLLTLSQEVLNRLVNIVFVFDSRQHQVVDVRDVILQFANKLAAAIGAFDLPVTEQVHLGKQFASQQVDASIRVAAGPVVAV